MPSICSCHFLVLFRGFRIQGPSLKHGIVFLFLLSLGCLLKAEENELRNSAILEQAADMARVGGFDYDEHIAPIVDRYCTDCHNPDDDAGGIDFEALLSATEAVKYPDLWHMVGKTAEMDVMPPLKKTIRPNLRERALLIGWGLQIGYQWDRGCLLYTSDAADE